MFNQPFTPSQVRPIRPAMTVSRPAQLGQEAPVTWFSLGAGTSITPEFYDCTTLYLGGEGSGTFVLGSDAHDVPMHPGQLLWVPPGTLCGTRTDNMKFVLMAFDEGTGLTPHRAPGNAILTALEGKAIIGYEGQDYELTAGQSFRFDKNGLHSVTAQGKFKMSLLLVIE